MRPLRRAVFLDKDGTLVENIPYNVDPDRIRFLPGVEEGIALLAARGYALVVVSNQPGVARGKFPEAALAAVEAKLRAAFDAAGTSLAGFYYCPHDDEGSAGAPAPFRSAACACRKPAPGLLLKAAQDLQLDLARSWMVGDILDDVQAGRRAGCRTVLIDVGNETEWRLQEDRMPDAVARHLGEAARLIAAQGARYTPVFLEANA
jgi:histidinol-phosphate phosphatase family protein